MMGNNALHRCSQLLGVQVGAGFGDGVNHKPAWATLLGRHRNRGGFGYTCYCGNHPFDLGRADLYAAEVHGVVGATVGAKVPTA